MVVGNVCSESCPAWAPVASSALPLVEPKSCGKRRSTSRDSDHAIGRRWPDEAALLQPFGAKRHAEAVMPDDLDQVATRASDDKEIACMGVRPQPFLAREPQVVHAAPHVLSSGRKPDSPEREPGSSPPIQNVDHT